MATKRPLFSNGTEFMFWSFRNCEHCHKAVQYNESKNYMPKYRCAIQWHENGYFYIDDSFGEFPKDCVKPVGDFFDNISTDFKGTQITVSGNIHDRPELWKGGAR